MRCPICRRELDGSPKSAAAFPFCSARCRAVDLGLWLDGSYRLAVAHDDGGGEAELRGPAPSPRDEEER